VFILEHYFASKSCAAVREAFSNAYPDKELPNKTIHLLVTKFRGTGSVCDRKSSEQNQTRANENAKDETSTGQSVKPGEVHESVRHTAYFGVHL
jgi:hypothetical protein